MKTSELAKTMGAKSLQQVADFYGVTPSHLRNVHKRNDPAFRAMVRGFLCQRVEHDRLNRDIHKLIARVIDFTGRTKHTDIEWLSAVSSDINDEADRVLNDMRNQKY